jgi:hypothetical protein
VTAVESASLIYHDGDAALAFMSHMMGDEACTCASFLALGQDASMFCGRQPAEPALELRAYPSPQ